MKTNAQPTNSMDSELEEIYQRCDVSNNGTENPMSLEEFIKAINSKYIRRDLVEEAIGEDEKHQDSSFGGALPAFETEPMKHRNQFRAELRSKLLNKETE